MKKIIQPVLWMLSLWWIAGIELAHSQTSYEEHISAGFYPYMKDYVLKPEEIDLGNLTHLIYCFAGPRADGSISTESGSYHNPSLVQRVHDQGRKFIVMMGGGLQSGGYHAMASSQSTRTIFINTLVDWIRTYGYDGVNIDWEYPGANNKDEDRDNLTALVIEMRDAFDALEGELGKELEISIDVHSSLYYAQWVDFATLKNYIDWFGLMSYDYAGNWSYSIHAAHNAPLYCGPPEICERYLNVDLGVKNLRDSLGIPASSIVMGVAFYGREFYNQELYDTPREGGGGKAYYDIEPLIGNGWDRIWDDDSKVPYLRKTTGSGIISYDDIESLTYKTDYIKENGLLGGMIWEITQDVNKVDGSQPLLDLMGQELVGVVLDNTGIPSVSLTAPSDGYVYMPGDNLTLTAEATVESPFVIERVEFYQQNTLIGTDYSAPYNVTWNNLPAGNYDLSARAFTTEGKSRTSSVVSITDGLVPEVTDLFDDFNYASADDPELEVINKWFVVDGVSGPPAGAQYRKENITFYPDPSNSDNTLMGVATTASPSAGATHARIETSELIYKFGTFAARVYFDDTPAIYGDGNVETFYTINSYSTCNQPDLYSEIDFEYLPWDAWHYERQKTMYMTTWETCEDRTHEKVVTSFEGWHDLVFTTGDGEPVNYYIDGQLIASIDTDHPDSDQNISFANWIYQNIVGSDPTERNTKMQVDWVYHAIDAVLSTEDVLQIVANYRQNRVLRKNIHGDQVVDGIAPAIEITDPTGGSNFVEGMTIDIAAVASDQDGTIGQIEFFANGVSIGSCTNSNQCTIQWTIPSAGNFQLTAQATDNQGIPGISQPVNITVDEVFVQRPDISITAPIDGAQYEVLSNVLIQATASDSEGHVVGVEFFVNGSSVSTDDQAPYEYLLSDPEPGNYTVYGIATNDLGNTKQSEIITFSVNEAPYPEVTITSPNNQSLVPANSDLLITADAITSLGSITKVDFYVNGSFHFSDTSAPFETNISNIEVGIYTLEAVAENSFGNTHTSAPITITARAPYSSNSIPGIIEAENYDLGGEGISYHDMTPGNAGGAHRSDDVDIEPSTQGGFNVGWTADGEWLEYTVDVTSSGNYEISIDIAAVDGYGGTMSLFFDGENKTGEVQVPSTGGWQIWNTITVNNVVLEAGTYNMRLSMPDAQYNIDKLVFALNDGSNIPPSVTITAPTEANFDTGSDIVLAANASDADGSVAKVDFYINGVLFDSDHAEPYSATMTNAGVGSYTLVAVATDDEGATGNSAEETFQVSDPMMQAPEVSISSPLDNAQYDEGSNITLAASASDADGSISNVAFYVNGSLLNTDTSAPYETQIADTAVGSYAIEAVATDNDGLTAMSQVNITVTPISTADLTLTYQTIVAWDSGFQGEFRITNNSASTANGWTVEFDCGNNIAPIWDAVIVDHSGNHYVVTGTSATQTIAGGQSVVFGFIGNIGQGQSLSTPVNETVASGAPGARLKVETGLNHAVSNSALLYPNPVTGLARITLQLDIPERVEIGLYNLSGRKVRHILNEDLLQGAIDISWDSSDLENGLFVLKFGSQSTMKPIFLIKE